MSIFGSNIVGIDFHDHLVQFVDLSRRGRKTVLNAYNRITLPEGMIVDGVIQDTPNLKNILIELFKTANPGPVDPKQVAVVLPSSAVFTHIFEFPLQLSENDIRQAIPYEAETVIPFSIQEVYWDFQVLEKDPKELKGGKQRVLFASIPSEVAQNFSDLFAELGIQPVAFGIDLDAIQQALRRQLKLEDTALVIDLGALSVNYTLVDHGVVKSFYSSPEAVNGLIQSMTQSTGQTKEEFIKNWGKGQLNEAYVQYIDAFLKKKYHRAQQQVNFELSKRNISSIDRVILTGEFANLPHFYESAYRYFPKSTIEVGDPKHVLSIDDKRFAAHIEGKGQDIPYSIYFTTSIGIAIKVLDGKHRSGINLIPENLKQTLHQDHRLWLMALASVGMAFFGMGLAGYMLFLHQDLGFERVNLEIKKSAIERQLFGTRYIEVQKQLIEFNSEVEILSKIDAELFSVPVVFEQIEDLIPEGIRVVRQRFTDETLSVEIDGIADGRNSILDFKTKLDGASFIESIDMPLSNFDQSKNIPFRVTIFLNFAELPDYASSPAK